MVRKLFWQMSKAQIAASITVMSCLLIDSFVIGRLIGPEALGAYGLANPIMTLFAALGNMMVCGIQVVFGKHMGRGDSRGMNVCFSSSIGIALALSAAVIPVMFLAWQPICGLLGAGQPTGAGSVFLMTRDYLWGYCAGIPLFFFYQMMVPYMQMLGKRKLIFISITVMTLTNMALDLASVYLLHWGLFGIGLGTELSYLVALIVPLVFLLKKECPLRFSWKLIGWNSVRDIFRGGSSMIVSDSCYVLSIYCINRILLSIAGSIGVAAYSVMTTLTNLVFCIGLGTGAVTLTLSSVFYGDMDRASILALIRAMVSCSLRLISAAVLLVELFAPWLVAVFVGDNPDISPIAVSGLRLLTLSLIPAILSNGFRSYCHGIQRPMLPNLIAVMRFFIPTVPLAWALGRLYGLNGVWIGVILGEMITLLVICAAAWRQAGAISLSAETFCLLEEDFDAEHAHCLDMTIREMDDVIDASEQMNAYCLKLGLDNKTAMLIGVCVEEIGVNIIKHGFSKDHRQHSIETHLTVKADQTILRIRDDCVNFDPVKYLELHQDDDPVAHIGLRMTMRAVKEANYVNSLGLNILTLIL